MATENLLVSGDTATINLSRNTGDHNYEMVNDAVGSPDDDTTYVYTSSNTYKEDRYNLANSVGSGTISKITVHYRARGDPGMVSHANAKCLIESGETTAYGTEYNPISYGNFSEEWATDPNTGEAWTWDAIDALIVGIALGTPEYNEAACTQVYVEVDYEPQSSVPLIVYNRKMMGVE